MSADSDLPPRGAFAPTAVPGTTTVPLTRAWNTWGRRPAEMMFLPLGVRLTPVAYAASTRQSTDFPPGGGARYGRHAVDGSLVEIGLDHAGTHVDLTWTKPDHYAVVGSWTAPTLGEWGLRFWFCLCVSADGGEIVRHDAATGATVVRVGHRFVAVVSADAPSLVSGHPTIADLKAEYERHGYWHLSARSDAAPVLALRFNFEMMRTSRIAAAVADREDLAVARAKAALASEAPIVAPAQEGANAGSLDAVRDVIAWNTVWDGINARPYTAISRNWDIAKFGGFGVWLDDQLYAAMAAAMLDPELARENLAVSLSNATPEGNLACLITAMDGWVDRTQIPVASFVAWSIFARTGSRSMLSLAYDALARNQRWWWRVRDPHGRGLVSYGTSDVGEGLYKGTHFGARNESSMDNAPIHDETRYDPETRTLDCLDVGLNSLVALDAEMLALIAAELGDAEGAAEFAARAEATRRRIREELWDESRGIFANRLWDGRFVKSVGPTSFYPLIAGAASPEQVERLLAHLDDPELFGGRFGLPGVARNDPAFPDNTYWRGRIWPPLNFLTWHGLKRVGRHAEASKLASKSLALFAQSWDERRLCPENFNADSGEALDQPDTEGFYGWGVLMPAMGVGEIVDVTPWEGFAVVHDGRPVRLGPLETPAGRVTVESDGAVLSLSRGGAAVFSTNVRGRLTHLRLDAGGLSVTLPAGEEAGILRLPGVPDGAIVAAAIGGGPVIWRPDGDGVAVGVPRGRTAPMRLVVAVDREGAR